MNAIEKYPFDRLTEDAKLTLVRAQEEAERIRAGYIGTEHILLGLLRVESGAASRVLRRFDVSLDRVRNTVSAVTVRLVLSHAVAAHDTEHALRLGSEENRLEKELQKAEREWLDSLG